MWKRPFEDVFTAEATAELWLAIVIAKNHAGSWQRLADRRSAGARFGLGSRAAMPVPSDPAIYHITHIDNLPGIMKAGCLWSDARRVRGNLQVTNIGYSHIKRRRLTRPVPVAAKGMLGDYVPFNFCPRSVMLYVVSRGHVDYNAGQSPIVHLVSTMRTAINTGRSWAFTDRHADLRHAEYYDNLKDLGEVAWEVMPLRWWNDPPIHQELRQAEFLVHDWFRFDAFTEIGVIDEGMASHVRSLLARSGQRTAVHARPDWYYEGLQ